MNRRRRPTLIMLTAAAALTVLALAPAGVAGASGAARHGAQASAGGAALAAGGAPAGTGAVSQGQYPSWAGRFYSVSAASAKDVWAVGLSAAGGQVANWNGSSWADYDFVNGYQNVWAQSPTDVWAVGGTSWFYPTQTLARHWDGKTWTQVPTPSPGGTAWFNGVAATSPTNAWAVGCTCGGPGDQGFMIPIIERWNGKTWKQQFFRLPVNSGAFNSVAATGPDNAWAVGSTGTVGPNGALIEHWNGHRWRRIPANTPDGFGNLQGVTAISPNDVWAVGYTATGPDQDLIYESLTLHWNGKRWSVVPSPNPTGETNLWAVSASSPTNVWAVGYTNPNTCCAGTAAFHWNGKRWRVTSTVNPPDVSLDALLGVVAISPDDVWAVGTTDWSSTIIEHWNGKTWQT
jgi:hypothetical protein